MGDGQVTEVSIWSEGRPHTIAKLVVPKSVDDRLGRATMAVDALLSLGGDLFEPLSVDIELACCDIEFGLPLIEPLLPARFHQLRVAMPPESISVPETWHQLVVDETERLDRSTILDWVAALLDEQRCPQPDTITGWSQLIVEAVRARLPGATGRGVEGGELPVAEGAGVIRFPVERSGSTFWVAGPFVTSSDTAPFGVRIVNEGRVMYLDWSRNWSTWIEENGAGRPDVEAAVQRLSALGWEVEPGELS